MRNETRLKRLEAEREDKGIFVFRTVYENRDGSAGKTTILACLLAPRHTAIRSTDFGSRADFVAAVSEACRSTFGRELTAQEMEALRPRRARRDIS